MAAPRRWARMRHGPSSATMRWVIRQTARIASATAMGVTSNMTIRRCGPAAARRRVHVGSVEEAVGRAIAIVVLPAADDRALPGLEVELIAARNGELLGHHRSSDAHLHAPTRPVGSDRP